MIHHPHRLIVTFALIVCVSPALAGSTLDRVNSTKTLNNVVFEYYPPFGFINDKNELAGFDVAGSDLAF